MKPIFQTGISCISVAKLTLKYSSNRYETIRSIFYKTDDGYSCKHAEWDISIFSHLLHWVTAFRNFLWNPPLLVEMRYSVLPALWLSQALLRPPSCLSDTSSCLNEFSVAFPKRPVKNIHLGTKRAQCSFVPGLIGEPVRKWSKISGWKKAGICGMGAWCHRRSMGT